MKEWNNPYNPFNSAKILMYADKLKQCAAGECPVPVTVAIDPTNKCNYDCIWCNAYDIRHQKRVELSKDELLELADFIKDWGVRSTCVAGGGEPYMNKHTSDLLIRCKENGLSNSIITNGSLLTHLDINVIANTCRWVGISMDASSVETYNKVKGISNDKIFDKVLDNISEIRGTIDSIGSDCDIGYKFLLHPFNQHEIYNAAVLAKSVGADDFQVRPVGWENMTLAKGKLEWNFESINSQLEKMFELEDDNFHVYGIRHKYANDLKKKVNFNKCRASSLHPAFCADGKLYSCIDMRGKKELVICDYLPEIKNVLKHWNSKGHKAILNNINVNSCTKCTFAGYNEIIEKVFIQDTMCRNHI